uniref:ribosomal protein L32 n=1 Tax=Cephaleuros virescens TaxID=173371 RepID=UPI001EDCBB19|nr:ribosomal protein L32 [Cephaleuros virescens]UIB38700.1 ribosomal protein L32 [Cephaleuros virescens]
MSVPKKRTSYSKKKIRKKRWFNKIIKFAQILYSQGPIRRQVDDESTEQNEKSNNL